ncbi:MAG: hypothetical protein ACREBE_26955, partial [bacterium]
MLRRLVPLLFVVACDTDPIAWQDPHAVPTPPSAARLRLDSAGRATFVSAADSTPIAPPAAPGMCKASFRTARGTTRLYGAWWSVRPDSSAALYTASSADGGRTWGTPSAVDTLDV